MLLVSIDTACTMAVWGRDFAFVCILADLLRALSGSRCSWQPLFALSPRQFVVTVVLLASVAMFTIWSLLGGFARSDSGLLPQQLERALSRTRTTPRPLRRVTA